jgi:hypothetical protein
MPLDRLPIGRLQLILQDPAAPIGPTESDGLPFLGEGELVFKEFSIDRSHGWQQQMEEEDRTALHFPQFCFRPVF